MSTKFKTVARTIGLLCLFPLLFGCGPKKARILERADRYFKSGEYDKAKIEYLNVLRLDNQNVTAFRQVGIIWSEQGAPLRAAPFLMRARELAPEDAVARIKLGLVFQSVGRSTDARKEAILVLDRQPANADALMLAADSSRTKEDIADLEKRLQNFPDKQTAAFRLASASLAMSHNDLGGAADEVQQALTIDPKSPNAHEARAYLYLFRKDPGHAGAELKSAADVSPARSQSRIKYAEFQAANGAIEEAKKSLQSITHEAPDYLPAWRDLAQISLSEKKYDEALAALENVFSRDAENPEARIVQSDTLIAKGDPAKAITILEKLNDTYHDNPIVKYALGRAYLAANNTVQAVAAFEQAIAVRPDYPEAVLALAELNLRDGKPQQAASAIEGLLQKHPDVAPARILLARAYQALGRTDAAAAVVRDQIKLTPQSFEAYFDLGLMLRRENKAEEARQAFSQSAQLAPDDFRPVDQLVEMDLAAKRYDAATERVQRELTKHPNAAASHVLEAKIYIAHASPQDFGRAEAALQKAIELDPGFVVAYQLLVSVYLAENKLPQAITQLEGMLKKNPADAIGLVTLAMAYGKTSDYSKASATYEKLITLQPNLGMAFNNLAVLYSEQLNRPDRAYELAQKARSLQPGDASTADTLGWILYKRGDYQQAMSLLQESAGKIPDNPEVQFHLGMTSYMMGQADAARSALEKAVHSASDFPGKSEAQNRLAQLNSTGKKPGSENGPSPSFASQSNDLLALLRDAEASEKQGDSNKAAAGYEKAYRLNPKIATTALKLAQLKAGPLHQSTQALDFAHKARDLAPNDPKMAGAIGGVALQAGNFSWAYSLLQESARSGTEDPAVLHDLAMASYALGRVTDARQAMQRVVSSASAGAEAEDGKRFLAMTAMEQPSAEAAAGQDEVETTLKTQPDYVPALMAKAAIQVQRNDPNAAAAVYSDVLRKYPDFAPAQKRLAAIYAADSSSLSKAHDLAMKARRSLPDDPELARTLAEISFKRNEFPYAVQLFRESASKQPLSPTDMYYLGMAQLQSRQETEGRKTLEQALSAGLPDPLAQEAKKRLAPAGKQ